MRAPYSYEFDALPCMTCDGTGEVDCGRDWQRMSCDDCAGTGYAPRQSREDYEADQGDAAADQEWIDAREQA